jgi:hypothetical protein
MDTSGKQAANTYELAGKKLELVRQSICEGVVTKSTADRVGIVSGSGGGSISGSTFGSTINGTGSTYGSVSGSWGFSVSTEIDVRHEVWIRSPDVVENQFVLPQHLPLKEDQEVDLQLVSFKYLDSDEIKPLLFVINNHTSKTISVFSNSGGTFRQLTNELQLQIFIKDALVSAHPLNKPFVHLSESQKALAEDSDLDIKNTASLRVLNNAFYEDNEHWRNALKKEADVNGTNILIATVLIPLGAGGYAYMNHKGWVDIVMYAVIAFFLMSFGVNGATKGRHRKSKKFMAEQGDYEKQFIYEPAAAIAKSVTLQNVS